MDNPKPRLKQKLSKHGTKCEISGSDSGKYEDDSLLGYSVM
jgi:hypothetical protein